MGSTGWGWVGAAVISLGLLAAALIVIRRIARDRARRDAAWDRARSLLAATLEATTDGIVVIDNDRRLTHWNRQFVRMWRLPEDVLSAGGTADALAAISRREIRDPEQFLARMREITADPEAEHFDVIEFLDGRVFERATRPLWVGGQVVGRVASFHDVTDAVRTTEALRHSESLFKASFDDAPVGIALVDHVMRKPFRVNRAMCDLLGYSADELVAMRFDDITYPDDNGTGEQISSHLTGDSPTPFLIEKRYVRKDGAVVWAVVSVVGVRDASGAVTHALTIFQDVTARRQAERALADQEEELRHAQKMEAVGRLAAGMAHDFNNLLTIIGGNCQLLLEGAEPLGALREISAATDRAAALTRQLLAFSRRQPLAPRVVDLGALVSDMDGLLRRLVGPEVAIRMDIGHGPAWIVADPAQMGQVVLNLVVNARDALNGRGEIRIDVWTEDAGHVSLRVQDAGCGMTDDVRQRIFEPFYTTKPVGEGTGLGLATVYGIVHQSGGSIVVDSRPGQGATFTIVLPAAEPPSPDAAGESSAGDGVAPPVATKGVGRLILVVDDEEGVRTLTQRVLTSAGFRVTSARNGEEGIRVFEASAEPIDCVVTDLLMPVMNGVDMVQRLRRVRPDLLVLYISGYFDGRSPLEVTLPPGTAVLNKPFTPPDLLRAVHGLLHVSGALHL